MLEENRTTQIYLRATLSSETKERQKTSLCPSRLNPALTFCLLLPLRIFLLPSGAAALYAALPFSRRLHNVTKASHKVARSASTVPSQLHASKTILGVPQGPFIAAFRLSFHFPLFFFGYVGGPLFPISSGAGRTTLAIRMKSTTVFLGAVLLRRLRTCLRFHPRGQTHDASSSRSLPSPCLHTLLTDAPSASDRPITSFAFRGRAGPRLCLTEQGE